MQLQAVYHNWMQTFHFSKNIFSYFLNTIISRYLLDINFN